jgi:hypothetical protein
VEWRVRVSLLACSILMTNDIGSGEITGLIYPDPSERGVRHRVWRLITEPQNHEATMNETFKHASRADARLGALQGGWDLDDLLISADSTGMWGWVLVEEPQVQATLEAPERFRRPDAGLSPTAPRLSVDIIPEDEATDDGRSAEEGTEPEVEAVEPVGYIEDHAPSSAAPLDPEPVAAPEPVAHQEPNPEPGGLELILQINGPMLPAAAKLRALHFARQLGLEITLRNASTMEVVEVVKASARGKGGRGNANDLIIEMCTRPEGATVTELRKAATERGASISGDVKEKIEKIAQEHNLDFTFEAVFRNNKPVIGFFLRYKDEEAAAAD